MAFLRYGRDKRGYESVSLVQPVGGRKGKFRTRVLYWYRTPPNVRVGRDPFDPDTRKAIETQNPGVSFDWAKLLETPKPPDVEKWRERRRLMKAQRAAAGFDEEPESDGATEDQAVSVEQSAPGESPDAGQVSSDLPTTDVPAGGDAVMPAPSTMSSVPESGEFVPEPLPTNVRSDGERVVPEPATVSVASQERRRRRRRGGRRHRRHGAAAGLSATTPTVPAPADLPPAKMEIEEASDIESGETDGGGDA